METGRVLQRVVTLKPEKKGIYLMTRKIYEEVPELKNVQAGTANLFLKVRMYECMNYMKYCEGSISNFV
jgi:hypothetical protein